MAENYYMLGKLAVTSLANGDWEMAAAGASGPSERPATLAACSAPPRGTLALPEAGVSRADSLRRALRARIVQTRCEGSIIVSPARHLPVVSAGLGIHTSVREPLIDGDA